MLKVTLPSSLLLLSSSFIPLTAAHAQDQPAQQPNAQAPQNAAAPEIVVPAQKREQRLQDEPISISVLSGGSSSEWARKVAMRPSRTPSRGLPSSTWEPTRPLRL
jgi:hypothetical protein